MLLGESYGYWAAVKDRKRGKRNEFWGDHPVFEVPSEAITSEITNRPHQHC